MPYNNKRIQIGWGQENLSKDFAFLNNVHAGAGWFEGNPILTPGTWALLDSNGFPTVDTPSGNPWQMSMFFPTQAQRAGNRVIKWVGGDAGTSVQWTSQSASGSGTGANGRFVVTPGAGDDFETLKVVHPSTSSGSHPTSYVVCHVDDEAAYDAGGIFQQQFIDRIGVYGVVRHLDSQSSNGTQLCEWGDRTPSTWYSYGAPFIPPRAKVGSATSTRCTFTGSVSSNTLTVTAVSSGTVLNPYVGCFLHGSTVQEESQVLNHAGTQLTPICRFTASISGTSMTVSSIDSGGNVLAAGQAVWITDFSKTQVTSGTVINSQSSGTTGGAGVYVLNNSMTRSPASMATWGTGSGTTGTYNVSVSQTVGSTTLTTSDGVTFVMSAPGFSLVDRAMIFAQPDQSGANDYNGDYGGLIETLNVNGTGAKLVFNQNGQRGALFPRDGLSCAVYDLLNDAWMLLGPSGFIGVGNGIPYEICFELAKASGAHPWFVSPRYACDVGTSASSAVSDYFSSLAAYTITRQNSDMPWVIPRFETPNETWLFTNQNTNFAYVRQSLRDGSMAPGVGGQGNQDYANWIGVAASNMGQALKTAFGGTTGGTGVNKYHMIIGFGGYQEFPPVGLGGPVHKLTSPYYVAQSGKAGKEAYKFATHICYANYFASAYKDYPPIFAYAWQAVIAANSTAQNTVVSNYTDGTVLNNGTVRTYQNFSYYYFTEANVGGLGAPCTGWPTFGASYTNDAGNPLKCTHYEGGYSPDWEDNEDGFYMSVATVAAGNPTVITVQVGGNVSTASGANVAVAGAWMKPFSISGTMGSAINGNIYQVVSATGTTVTLNVDTTGLSGSGGGIFWYGKLAIAGMTSAVLNSEQVTVITLSTNVGGLCLSYPKVGHVTISGVTGAFSPMNGNVVTVITSTATTATVRWDSSGYSSFSGGGAVTFPSVYMVDWLQQYSKFQPSVITYETLFLTALQASGSEFPSEYAFAGGPNAFLIWDKGVYDTLVPGTPPRQQAVINWDSGTIAPSTPIQRPRMRLR